MIIELPNYVDNNTVNSIRDCVQPYLDKQKQHSQNRDGKTVCISKENSLKELDSQLNNIFTNLQINVVQDRYKPLYDSGDTGYEYHMYCPGDICHVHSDGELSFNTSNPNAYFLRYASIVLHLNTVHEGGELVFPTQNKTIKTEAGKVVVFPPYSMFQHYTTPSTATREVIVTWFVYNRITVCKD
jgi:predicted 2-oxoglutarate/Fe(II)-dependent dioxygenase YbiX